jgi:dTDP-glucose pyrophosphorylase
MKLLVLMAGGSDAFEEAGHSYPKNLVEIDGLPLAQRVVEHLAPVIEACTGSVFLIGDAEHRRFHTGDVIRLLAPGAEIVTVPQIDTGAACTALHAIGHVSGDEPLLVVNGDQILEIDLLPVVQSFQERELDGGVITFDGVHPRWSYVRTGADGLVTEAAEKRPISRHATAGAYWYRRGQDFVDAVMDMIRKDASVDGRFYICPAYNELILRQQRIGTYPIDRDAYFSLSSPRGVEAYEHHLERVQGEVTA